MMRLIFILKKPLYNLLPTFTKGKTISHAIEILSIYFLPHIGELNFKHKALYLGYIVMKLLRVYTKEDKATDRDSFKYKRIEVSGELIYLLFREYYNLQQKNINQTVIQKEYYYNHAGKVLIKMKILLILLPEMLILFFLNELLKMDLIKHLKEIGEQHQHTKRLGLVQDLNRLSFFSFICQLRKLNVPIRW